MKNGYVVSCVIIDEFADDIYSKLTKEEKTIMLKNLKNKTRQCGKTEMVTNFWFKYLRKMEE